MISSPKVPTFSLLVSTHLYFQHRLRQAKEREEAEKQATLDAMMCLGSNASECVWYPPWNQHSNWKMDGWNTSFLLGWPIFRCYVSFRECTSHKSWSPFLVVPRSSIENSCPPPPLGLKQMRWITYSRWKTPVTVWWLSCSETSTTQVVKKI